MVFLIEGIFISSQSLLYTTQLPPGCNRNAPHGVPATLLLSAIWRLTPRKIFRIPKLPLKKPPRRGDSLPAKKKPLPHEGKELPS
jgi:hypothetical protein